MERCVPRTRAASGMSAGEELEIALRAANGFTVSISQADTKAGLLVPVLAMAFGGLYSQAAALRAVLMAGSLRSAAAAVLLVVLLVGVLVALVFLAATLTPRTPPPAGRANVFAFPAFPHVRRVRDPAETAELRTQAWRQAETLAQIARTKFRRLRIAIRFTCIALLACVGCTALVLLG